MARKQFCHFNISEWRTADGKVRSADKFREYLADFGPLPSDRLAEKVQKEIKRSKDKVFRGRGVRG